jgi:hypothetical protein
MCQKATLSAHASRMVDAVTVVGAMSAKGNAAVSVPSNVPG